MLPSNVQNVFKKREVRPERKMQFKAAMRSQHSLKHVHISFWNNYRQYIFDEYTNKEIRSIMYIFYSGFLCFPFPDCFVEILIVRNEIKNVA